MLKNHLALLSLHSHNKDFPGERDPEQTQQLCEDTSRATSSPASNRRETTNNPAAKGLKFEFIFVTFFLLSPFTLVIIICFAFVPSPGFFSLFGSFLFRPSLLSLFSFLLLQLCQSSFFLSSLQTRKTLLFQWLQSILQSTQPGGFSPQLH